MGKPDWRKSVRWGMLMGAIALGLLPTAVVAIPSRAPQLVAGSATRKSTAALASTAAIADLAAHLKKIGAKMYGAYWCPHCTRQKAMFGNASADIPYVECDPRGENPQPQQCRAAGIKGYPTWEINGKQFVGVQSLEELAEVSGFKGAK